MKKLIILFLVLCSVAAWSDDRPVKLWGYGNWFTLSPKEWTYSKDMVSTFNDWTQKKFGFTWDFVGNLPKGSTFSQALAAYVAANGMPDLIIGPGEWNTELTNAFLEFTRDKKLADLTKYFNDTKNYPILSNTDKSYLRAYQVNGKMMAIPRAGWHMKADDPYSGGPRWIIRYDLMKKYGTPKTIQEFTSFLKKVKEDKPVDLDGNPTVPFTFGVINDWSRDLDGILQQSFGAGFNITEKGKLIPFWSTEEYGKALYYLNGLVRDGLADTQVLSNNSAWLNQKLQRGSYAVAIGPVSPYREGTLMSSIKKLGMDNPKIPEIIEKQAVMLVPPVADNPGRLTNTISGATMVSKDCPNLDKVMKFVDFLDSPEGLIMFMAGAGFKDEGWEWVDYPNGPIYWQNLGKEPGNRDLNVVFPWGSVINALGAISEPSSASYYEWMYYNKFVLQQRMGNFKIKIGQHQTPPDDATALEWGKEYANAIMPLTTPIPSWMQFKFIPDQVEIAANSTVTQRLNEWLPRVITAKSVSEYLDLYGQMLQVLVKSAPWRKIYEAKQTAYEKWLKDMKFDDRKGGKFNHPVREYLDAAGWSSGIY